MRDILRSYGFWQGAALVFLVVLAWWAGARGLGFALLMLVVIGLIVSGVVYHLTLRSAVKRTLEIVRRLLGKDVRCEGLGLRYYILCLRRVIRELTWLWSDEKKKGKTFLKKLAEGPFAVAVVLGDKVLEANPLARESLDLVPEKSPWGSVLSVELLDLLKKGEGSAVVKVKGRYWWVQVIPFGELSVLMGCDATKEVEFSRLERELVSAVAHHFRTPITVIIGYLELLGDEPRARVALKHARALADTVERVLELARAGEAPLNLEKVNLTELAAELVELYSRRAKEKGVRLDLEAEPAVVRSDRSLLYTVLQNLIDNAVKFTGAGGRVAVKVKREGGDVVVAVEDTGPGMSPEELSQAFRKFWRGKGEGVGLGLALVAEAVRRLGGRLEAESKPGVGTRFVVKLSQ